MRVIKLACICVSVCLAFLTIPLITGSLATSRIQPWPQDQVITVYNPTPWKNTVNHALAGFNATGVTPPLVVVSKRRGADVVIVADTDEVDKRCGQHQHCLGYASPIGHQDQQSKVFLPDGSPEYDERPLKRYIRLVAHEFGHVLGLRHYREGCSLMNQDVGERQCGIERLGTWNPEFVCGPLAPDVQRLAQLYQKQVQRPVDSTCIELSDIEENFTRQSSEEPSTSPSMGYSR
jgi:hypothetical protein